MATAFYGVINLNREVYNAKLLYLIPALNQYWYERLGYKMPPQTMICAKLSHRAKAFIVFYREQIFRELGRNHPGCGDRAWTDFAVGIDMDTRRHQGAHGWFLLAVVCGLVRL